MVRFLHTSDWQLGMRRYFLSAEAQARFDEARIDAITRMGQVARAENCAFIVVAGDVFETNYVDDAIIARAIDALRTIDIPVLLLPGNHDPLSPGCLWERPSFAARKPANVEVLDGAPIRVADGVDLLSAPWRSKRPTTDLTGEALAAGAPGDGIRILVAHGGIERFAAGRSDDPSLINDALLSRALANGAIHYVALGDRHSSYEIAPRAWYSGAPEPTAFDEVDAGNVLIVDVTPGACDVRRMPVGTWRFLQLDREVREATDIDHLLAELDAIGARRQAIVRLNVAGVLDFAEAGRLRAAIDERTGLFGALEFGDALTARPTAADLAALDAGGYLRDAIDELVARLEAGGEQAAEAEEALILLYRLAKVEAA